MRFLIVLGLMAFLAISLVAALPAQHRANQNNNEGLLDRGLDDLDYDITHTFGGILG